MMKKVVLICLSFLLIVPLFLGFTTEVDAKSTYVKGYYRKDGTYVKGHYRNYGGSSSSGSSSSSPSYDNYYTYPKDNPKSSYSSKSIVNLYNGKDYIGQANVNELVYVKGYYRKDGTFVRPHYKTHPNHYIRDNFSYLGISTLLPLDRKYPSYNYDKDEGIASVEHYLYTSTINNELPSNSWSKLKDYAKKLSSNDPNFIKELYGGFFYQSIGYDTNFQKALVEFDISGSLSPKLYLYQVLNEMGVKSLTYSQEQALIKYSKALTPNQYDNVDVFNVGKEFYELIGLDSIDIYGQIELDLLQKF